MTDRERHPLALPSGTALGGTAPDGRRVGYVHAVAPDDVLAAAGVLTGDEGLIAVVRVTLDGSDAFIDGDDEVVFLHSLAEVHPLGHFVVPTIRWFLRDSQNLPDTVIAIAAVLPTGQRRQPHAERLPARRPGLLRRDGTARPGSLMARVSDWG